MRLALITGFAAALVATLALAYVINTQDNQLILPTPTPTAVPTLGPGDDQCLSDEAINGFYEWGPCQKPTATPRPIATRRPVIIQRVDLNTMWGSALEGIGLTAAEAAEIIEYRCEPATSAPYAGELAGCPPAARGIVTIGELVDDGIFTEERAIDLRLTEITVQTWD